MKKNTQLLALILMGSMLYAQQTGRPNPMDSFTDGPSDGVDATGLISPVFDTTEKSIETTMQNFAI